MATTAERVAELRRKRQEEEERRNASSSSSATSSSTSESKDTKDRIAEIRERKRTGSVAQQMMDLANSMISLGNDTYSQYQSREQRNRGNGYRRGSSAWNDQARIARNQYEANRQQLYTLYRENKDSIDEDWFNSLLKGTSDAGVTVKEVSDAARSEKRYYSQWGSQEAYDSAIAQLKYASMSDEEIKKNADYYSQKESELSSQIRKSARVNPAYRHSSKMLADKEQELDNLHKEQVLYTDSEGKEVTWSDLYAEREARKEEQALQAYDLEQGKAEIDRLQSEYDQKIMERTAYHLDETHDPMMAETLANQDLRDIQSQLDSKKSEYSKALQAQKAPQMENEALADERFEELSAIGASARDMFREDSQNSTGDELWYYLNEGEQKVFNYYRAQSTARAQEYLDSIADRINQRNALGAYESTYRDNALLELAFGVVAGLNQTAEGMKGAADIAFDWSDGGARPTNSLQYVSSLAREDLGSVGPKLPVWLGGTSIGQVGYDVITTNSNMIASQAVATMINAIAPGFGSAVGAEALSTAVLGVSAAGNTYQQFLNEGMNKNQAKALAALLGVWEGWSEYKLGAIEGMSDKTVSNLLNNAGFMKAIETAGNGYVRAFARYFKDATQEGLEEVIQDLGETVITGLVTGEYDWSTTEEQWYNFALGALSAATMNAPHIAKNVIANTAQAKEVIKDGNAAKVAEYGQTFSADSLAYKLASQIDENTGAYKLGRLIGELNGVVTDQNIADIKQALVEKGYREKDAESEAEWIALSVYGDKYLSERQQRELDRNETLSEVVRDVIVNRNSTFNQRLAAFESAMTGNDATSGVDLDKLADEMSKESISERATQRLKAQDTLSRSLLGKSKSAVENLAESKKGDINGAIRNAISLSSSRASEARNFKAGTDNTVKIKGINSIEKGVATYQLENGDTVKSTDIVYATPEEATLYEGALDISASTEATNAILKAYDAGIGISARDYVLGMTEAYRYGFAGQKQSTIKAENTFYSDLTPALRDLGYKLGREDAKAEESIKAPSKGRTATKGVVTFDDTVGPRALSERQSKSIQSVEALAKSVTNNEFVFFASERTADGRLVLSKDMGDKKKGQTAPNGWYDPNTNKIFIDINAGMDGEGVIMWTAAHELTHYIRDWSPAKFRVLADFLVEQYGEHGTDFMELVRNKMAMQGIPFDRAYEEVVADSMQEMLTDPAIADKLQALKGKDQSLWEKIKEFIADLADKLRALVTEYEGLEAQTTESKLVREMSDKFDEIQSLFAEALVEAGDNYDKAEAMSDTEAFEDSSVAVLNQIRTPYTEGTHKWEEFVNALSPEAKEIHDLFYNFYTLSKITNTTNITGKHANKLNISSVFMTAQQWNEKIGSDGKWRNQAVKMAESLPEKVRKAMNFNLDGTLTPVPLETEFKMQKSMAQRLVDALGYETIDAEYKLGDKTITLPTANAKQSVGGEAYRRALIAETRKLYEEGKLSKVSIGTLSKDRWGSLGFLAANGKTGASGDLTTLCPQMMFNRGCWYCYRRAALESGVNNKLVAEKVWYTGEILRIKDADVAALNENGGLRIQSFGDWQPHFSAQLADILYDAETRGLQVKIITKEPSMIEYVAALKEQGLGKSVYFNISADYSIEKGPAKFSNDGQGLDQINWSRPYGRDVSGQVWWKRALTVEEAYEYRKKYPWVNVRIVATTTEEFIRGLKDPKVQVVTGYHGHIRDYERVDSTTGQHLVTVEPLGDAGMPRWSFADGKWSMEFEGKTKTHKKLAAAIEAENLMLDYYNKTCCITGRCATCKGKCGKVANDFYVKNATNADVDSMAFWIDHLTRKQKFEYNNSGLKYSERSYFADPQFVDLAQESPLLTALQETISHAQPYWSPMYINELFKAHPEYNYIERLQNKEASAAKEFTALVSKINDPKVLEDMRWFLVEAGPNVPVRKSTPFGDYTEFVSYKKSHTKGIKDFREIIDNRMSELKDVGGTRLNIKNNTDMTVGEVRNLFDQLNTNREIAELGKRVFDLAEKLNLAVVVTDKGSSKNWDGSTRDQGFYRGNKSTETGRTGLIVYRTKALNSTELTDQGKANILLHEMIHACTMYAIHGQDLSGRSARLGALAPTGTLRDALNTLDNIFRKVKNGGKIQNAYGLTDRGEFLAELSNPQFRDALLQADTVYVKDLALMLQAQGELLGISDKGQASAIAIATLDKFLDNFDQDLYDRFTSGRYYRTSANDIKYSDRILMGSYFSGGGTLESGLVYKMLNSEFAVEYDGKIAAVWQDNHGNDQMYVGDVRDFDPKGKQDIFYFHASPSCQRFSAANNKAGETDVDLTTAQATADALRAKRPPVFTCENVKQYIGTKAYKIITDALDELGYNWDVAVYKASDYGNPTKRERMVIRAVEAGLELPAKPAKTADKVSWGEATQDLWATELKPSTMPESFIKAIRNTPALKNLTLTKATQDRPLMIYSSSKSKLADYAWADGLAPTLTTKCGDARIIWNGRVYAPTPEFMGRLQGLPDNYKYPEAKTRAFKIIGNGIPVQLTREVMGGVLESAYQQKNNGEVLYSDRGDSVVYNRKAYLKEETVDRWLRSYAIEDEWDRDRSQAWVARIRTSDFIPATTALENRDYIRSEVKPLDTEALASEKQPMFFDVDLDENGKPTKITSHEGRHRSEALSNAGVDSEVVILFDYGNWEKGRESYNSVFLEGQARGSEFIFARDLTPLDYAHRDELIEKFATPSDLERQVERMGMRQTVRYSERGSFNDPSTGEDVKYSIRQEDPPKKTLKGYKVFFVKDGKLYPPMVANPGGEDTPIGVWLNADIGVQAPDSKTGRKQVKAGGKGTQGGSGSLAFRPGWHLGEVPLATQFDRLNPETGEKNLFPKDFVWAECEIAADVDYQDEAMSYGYTKSGKFQHSLAGLPKLPVDGYYRYRTNPRPDTVPWLITGAMKVNRLLSDDEVNSILAEKGLPPKMRQGGNKTLEEMGLANLPSKDSVKYQLRGYTEKQKENWAKSKRIILYENESQLRDFIRNALSDGQFNKKMYFGIVDADLAKDIYDATNLELGGRNVTLRAGNVRKINKDHGDPSKEALRGQEAVTENDYVLIPRVIGSPDSLERSEYNGRPAVRFTKTIDGRRITVFAVDSGGSLDLFVQTMYIGTKKGSVANIVDANAPAETSKTLVGTTPNDKVAQPNTDVNKNSLRTDSKGRGLTSEQMQYFSESVARDEQGRLLELYHGSPVSNITVFDRSRAGQHASVPNDRAIWFTDNRSFAEKFAHEFEDGSSAFRVKLGKKGTVYPVYLNLTNPLDLNNFTDDMRPLFYDAYAKFGMDRARADAHIDELLKYGNHQYLKTMLDFNAAEELGYDGIIARLYATGENKGDALEYGVFNPEQIKAVSNKAPTADPNIYYSERQRMYTPEEVKQLREEYKAIQIEKTRQFTLDYLERKARSDLKKDQALYEAQEALKEFKDRQSYITWWLKQIHQTDLDDLEDSLRDYYQGRISEDRLKAAQREFELKNKIKDLKHEYAYKLWWVDKINSMRTREIKAGFRETRAKDYYKPRIARIANEMSDRLLHPSAKKVIPEAFQATVADFLASIDTTTFMPDGSVRGGRANERRANARAALSALANQLRENSLDSMYGQLDISPDMMDWIASMQEWLDNQFAVDGTMQVNKMTAEQLQTLYKTLRSLQAAINRAGRLYTNMSSDVSDLALETKAHLEPLTTKGHSKLGEKLAKTFAWDYAQPVSVFDRFGRGGQEIFKGLIQGQSRQAMNQQVLLDFIETAYTAEESKAWSKEIQTVTIDGKDYKVTTATLMGLHCLLQQEDSYRHIVEGGGLRFDNVEEKGKTYRYGNTLVSLEEAAQIDSMLTDRQKEVAEALQNFMAATGAEWGNEISMTRFGYKAFGVENYYPIHTVARGSEYEAAQARANIYALLNKSFTKERKINANNAIVIEDIFKVFADHMSEMSLYNAWALPAIDTLRWFNYKEAQNLDASTAEWDIHTMLNNAFGPEADAYIRRLLESINGQTSKGLSENIAFASSRAINRVAVAGNIRVAIQQPFSITRAFELIDPKYVKPLVGKARRAAYDEMLEHSGLGLWKSLGYFGIDTSRSFEEQVLKNQSFADKVTEKAMTAAEDGDNFTWAVLWNACKAEVSAKNKGLTEEEILQMTTDRFNDLVVRTQVMDSVLTKSQWMRANDWWHRMTSAFMSEPMTSYNTLLRRFDAFSRDAQVNGSKSALSKNWKPIAKTIAVFALTQLVNAMVTAPIDSMRDDDDYKTFLEKLVANFKRSAMQNMLPTSMMPYISDLVDYITYGSTDRADMTLFTSVVDFAKQLSSISENSSPAKINKLLRNALRLASYFSGLPMSNVTRDVVSIWNTIVGDIDYGRLKIQTSEDPKSTLYDKLFDEMSKGNGDRVTYLYAQGLSNSVTEDNIKSGVTTRIKEAYMSGDLTADEAEDLLRTLYDLVGASEKDKTNIFWKLQEWQSNAGGDDYHKYDKFAEAVRTGKNLKAVIKEYTDNGVSASTLAGQITSAFKAQYVAATKSERAAMKGYLLNAYELLGYDRTKKSKDIDKWVA